MDECPLNRDKSGFAEVFSNTIGLWGFGARPCALDVIDSQIQLIIILADFSIGI